MSLLFLFGSCEKSPDIPQNNNNPNNDPAQYGTPFAGVPEAPDATIYQVNMRTFSDAGNFQGVTARLDDIKNLGVNVIYLMPIHPIGIVKTVNSPYCIRDYKAINSEFGNLDDLRQLVDGAHERGMAVYAENDEYVSYLVVAEAAHDLADAMELPEAERTALRQADDILIVEVAKTAPAVEEPAENTPAGEEESE